MESSLQVYKIRKECIEELRSWGSRMMGELLSEAVSSLAEENCVFEEARIFTLGDKVYLIGIMLSQPGKKIVRGSDSEINTVHRELFKKAIVERIDTETLYSLSNTATSS